VSVEPGCAAPDTAAGPGELVTRLVGQALTQDRTGGCTNPVHLVGHTDTVNTATGELLASVDSNLLPGRRLLVACDDRRAAVCPSCARLYQADTYHLVRAGLAGGKGVPASVAGHPAVFATFTPPGFGPVHTRRTDPAGRARACRPRRDHPTCGHGRPVWCQAVHPPADRMVGQPLCLDCYDYPAAVLWQANAGRLWAATALAVRRNLATAAGVPVRRLPEVALVSYVRVAEFQRRGLIHLHAIFRLDGPSGPGDPPPGWASAELLAHAVHAAHRTARVTAPYSAAYGEPEVRWGRQFDMQPIHPADDLSGLGAPVGGRPAVAGYLAKYSTKSTTQQTATTPHRLRALSDLDGAGVSEHARRMAVTCWRLGGLAEYRGLRLRGWAHTLGWRGHTSTKSRHYSTTLAALRQARTEHHYRASGDGRPQGGELVREAVWRYAGRGPLPGSAARGGR
jgi:Replication initiator protein, pSAM2